MLSHQEVRERLEYCICVLLQLEWLLGNSSIPPLQYPEILKGSSLGLADDPFITQTLAEARMTGHPEEGLQALIHFYEGLVHALCEVLETDSEEVQKQIPGGFLRSLAGEVQVEFPVEPES